jgi:hypothetical protein
MRALLGWISRNSGALEGLAAITVVVGALVAVPLYLSRALSADLIVTVQKFESTVPRDFAQWSIEAADVLRSEAGASRDTASPAARLSSSPVAVRLRYGVPPTIDRLSVTLANRSTRPIPGVRIRVTSLIGSLWGTGIAGTFLTDPEARAYIRQLDSLHSSMEMALPELPPIPGGSALTLNLYGEFSSGATASVAVPSASTKVRRVVSVQDSWLVDLSENHWKLWFHLFFALGLLALAAIGAYAFGAPRVIRAATPAILYNAACTEAKKNRSDAAIHLLEAAFAAGYSDRHHARQDPDLDSLRERADFQGLLREPM